MLLWVCRGEADIRIGARSCRLLQGEAIWVPAGISHRIELDAGAFFPMGNRYGRVRIRVDELRIFTFPKDAENYLLHVHLAEYFDLMHPESPPTLIDELFQEQFVSGIRDSASLTGAVGSVAAVLRRNPADSRSLADWARALGTNPSALGKEFVSQTGATFPRWRAELRMKIARDLLCLGERPGDIARRLGYARPSAFTKVFTETHGIPPREYQRRETGRGTPAQDRDTLA